jgi:uncharacterized membrane protein
MTFIATFIVLCILGIADTLYLVLKHRQKTPLVCPLNHDCSKVTESPWSRILVIRNEFLGLLFYSTLLVLSLLRFVLGFGSVVQIWSFVVLLTFVGAVFSIFLILVQRFIIKDYCFYCIISAVISVFLFINSLVL